jgi:tRNA A37 threonylcarbamoyladenosine synthetase subunit TsaC/SUA5/YrdC
LSQYFAIHPHTPQAGCWRGPPKSSARGGLVVYPTDTTYALGCQIGDKGALERIRQIRRLDKHHHFTLTCRDLSEIATYARVDDASFRILKQLTPGPFTFLLPATKEVPRRLVHPKKKTIGLRVPGPSHRPRPADGAGHADDDHHHAAAWVMPYRWRPGGDPRPPGEPGGCHHRRR